MLIEIRCDAFQAFGKPRPPIIFNAGLNTILGDNVGTNSIGKSTLLMIIDFVFGGDDYVTRSQDVQKNIGPHRIQFAFQFNNQKYYFSRNTDTYNTINKCDINYNVLSDISINDFRKFILDGYNINLLSMSFRDIVSRYFRIYRRENLDENHPLRSFPQEREEDSIISLEKLFDFYSSIEELRKSLKYQKEKSDAFKKAVNFEFIHISSSKKSLIKNEQEISALKIELAQIDNRKNIEQQKFLEGLEPEVADQISTVKKELATLRRNKNRLETKIGQIQSNQENSSVTLQNDFSLLQGFFPSVSIQKIQEIEKFHAKLVNILKEEFASEQLKTEELLVQINRSIDEYQAMIDDIGLPDGISRKNLDDYHNIKSRIESLEAQNKSYSKQQELKETVETIERQLEKIQSNHLRELQNSINRKMFELNDILYEGQKKAPILTFNSRKKYIFETPDDTGTGISYKSLVVFDLSIIELTPLPVLVHDSVILKQIADAPLEKILELYKRSGKQIFISLDKANSYGENAMKILEKTAVICLSDKGNELFGRSWSIK